MIKIINDNGRPWIIAIESDTIKFYDGRYEHTDLGQFVSEYYTKAILGGNSGLCLDGGVPAWSISQSGMDRVRTWIKSQQKPEYFTVWAGGTEVIAAHLTEEHAHLIAEQYRALGHDDIIIEKI
jgi:hypothetical protein